MTSIALPSDAPSSPEPDVPRLDLYLPATGDTPRGAVLVCPGGGYARRAPHEGEPVAQAFNRRGLAAFVLQYRVAPCRHPAPLSDAVRAMRCIRRNAPAWGIDPSHVAVCGFSAGGHLAASLATHHATIPPDHPDDPSARPDAMILCYAVLCAAAPHRGSFTNLLGPDAPESDWETLCIERAVTADAPPAFLWHTADDGAVPVEGALRVAAALRRQGVAFELHVYPHGRHGLGLADDPPARGGHSPRIAGWFDACCDWLSELGWSASEP